MVNVLFFVLFSFFFECDSAAYGALTGFCTTRDVLTFYCIHIQSAYHSLERVFDIYISDL